MRELNEDELRSVSLLLYETCVLVRTTIGKWYSTRHRPTQDELLYLGMRVKEAEDQVERLATGQPMSRDEMDQMIEDLNRDIEVNHRSSFAGAED